MSYLAYEELEESSTTLPRLWQNTTSIASLTASIQSRSVRFREPITDTVRFEKESAPKEVFNPKFQVPCDTVFPSSGQLVTLIR
jgi:hypothetical protein